MRPFRDQARGGATRVVVGPTLADMEPGSVYEAQNLHDPTFSRPRGGICT